jgi:hypothetical protein
MQKFSDEWAIVATIDPDAGTAGTYLSDEIDMSKYTQLAAIVMAGTLGASATIDATFQSAPTAGGTYADISGKAITQLTKAGSDDGKQAVVSLRGDEGGDRYVKLELVVGTATSDCGAIVLGRVRYGPATDYDLSTVDEVV